MNKIIVSQLPALGVFIDKLKELPSDIGIEFLYESGNDYFWKYNIPFLTTDRNAPFSVHGPFSRINLADPEADWEEIKENYKRCFEFCSDINAVHCVCHPDAKNFRSKDPQNPVDNFVRAVDRLAELNEISKRYSVNFLIENLPAQSSIFTKERFEKILLDEYNFNFILDVGHAIISGWDVPSYIEKMGSRLKAFHLHEPSDNKDTHCVVGSGHYEWSSFFRAVQQNCPDAYFVLEYEKASVDEIINSICYIRQNNL